MLDVFSGPHKDKYLSRYVTNAKGDKYPTLESAMERARNDPKCNGITLDKKGMYTVRRCSILKDSPNGELSWKKITPRDKAEAAAAAAAAAEAKAEAEAETGGSPDVSDDEEGEEEEVVSWKCKEDDTIYLVDDENIVYDFESHDEIGTRVNGKLVLQEKLGQLIM